MTLYAVRYASPLGNLLIVSSETHILHLSLPGQGCKHAGPFIPGDNLPVLIEAQKWLNNYFLGEKPEFLLPLNPQGTPFQRLVWEQLSNIPYGNITTYGQIAKDIAKLLCIGRMSAQAVGQAVGANPISIIVPCHRVVGQGGKLTGYSGGLDKKIWLLEHENIRINKLRAVT